MDTIGLLQEISQAINYDVDPASDFQDILANELLFSGFLGAILKSVAGMKERELEHEREVSREQASRIGGEQALRVIENKFKRQEEELAACRERVKALESALLAANGEREKLVAEGRSGEAKIVEHEAAKSAERVAVMEEEAAGYIRAVERKQAEIDGLNAQLESQGARVRELREVNARLEEALLGVQSKLTAAQLSGATAQQEAEKYKKQSEWNGAELEQSIESFNAYRKQKSVELAEARLRLDATSEQARVLEEQLKDLARAAEEKDRRLEQSLSTLQSLQSRMADQEATFEAEMHTKSRLAELYKAASEDAQRCILELQDSAKALQEQMGDVEGRIQQIQAAKEEAVKQAYDLVDEKESRLELLRNQLDQLAQPADSAAMLLSPSAASASRAQRSGKSFSDVYAEYVQAKAELIKIKQENDRLKACLQEICADIEARVPQLEEERKENGRLKREVMSMSQQLIALSRSHDRAMDECASLKRQLDEAERDRKALKTEVADLSHQVQSLLQEVDEGAHGSYVPEQPGRDSDSVITGRLVSFRSIQELQVRNQELLRVVRQLSAEQESDELERARLADAATKAKLDAAHKELQELREARQRQAIMVESIVRQRDMLKEMLQKGGERSDTKTVEAEPSMRESYERLQRDHQVFREEKEKTERLLDQQLEQARGEASELRVQFTKAQSQLTFTNERLALLQQNFEVERRQVGELSRKNADCFDTILKQQSQIQSSMNDLLASREKEQKAVLQLSGLQAELGMLRAAEKRLAADNEIAAQEKQRLNHLVIGLQRMLSEHEGVEGESRVRLSQQLDVLERELQAARRRLGEQADAHRHELASLERDRRDLQQRLEATCEGFAKAREELVAATARVREQALRIASLESVNESNERRLSEFMAVPEGADSNRELVAAHIRISGLKDEAALARQHSAHFQAIAAQAEASVAELTELFDGYKELHGQELQHARDEVLSLRSKIEDYQRLVGDFETKFDDAARQFEGKEQRLRSAVAALEARLGELVQYEEQVKSQKAVFGDDLEHARQMLREANERYEREVVAHGQDLEQLRSVKAELSAKSAQVGNALKEIQDAQDRMQQERASLGREREGLDARLAEMETRSKELAEQNELLIGQLEQRYSTEPTSSPGRQDGNNLGEVVKFLRRQRDILQCELDSLQQDHRRLLAQLETTRRLLDEARTLLEEERSQSSPRYAAMLADYQRLLEKVEQYNIVRESNQVLRQESTRLAERLEEAETQLGTLRSTTINSLEEQVRNLAVKVNSHEEETRIIREDRDRWRARFNELLSKHDDRIDAAELQRLRDELASAQQELSTRPTREAADELQQRLQSLQQTLDSRNASMVAKLREMKAKNDELARQNAELGKAGDKNEELEACRKRIAEFEGQLAEAQGAIAAQSSKFERLNTAISKLKQAKDDLQASSSAQLEQLRQQHGAELEQQRKEHKLHEEVLVSSMRARIGKLERELSGRASSEPVAKTPEAPGEEDRKRAGDVLSLPEPAKKPREEHEEEDDNYGEYTSEISSEASFESDYDEKAPAATPVMPGSFGDAEIPAELEQAIDMPSISSSAQSGSEEEEPLHDEAHFTDGLSPSAPPFIPDDSFAVTAEKEPVKRRVVDLSHVGSGSRRLPMVAQPIESRKSSSKRRGASASRRQAHRQHGPEDKHS